MDIRSVVYNRILRRETAAVKKMEDQERKLKRLILYQLFMTFQLLKMMLECFFKIMK